tara:strand:+ start:133 stop:396 length:264 start_codon:yes stop_codon:yes gene_type:complete
MNLKLLNAGQEEYRNMSKKELLEVVDTYIEHNDEVLERWQNRLDRVRELKEEITHLKNLIVTMSYDINYEDGSIIDTSIQNIRKEIL